MLQRIDGMSHATRHVLLGQSWWRRWDAEIPPALYFDSAEPPAVFLGLPGEDVAGVRNHVRELVQNAAIRAEAIDRALAEEPGETPSSPPDPS